MSKNEKPDFEDLQSLQSFVGIPSDLAANKAVTSLDKYCISFINRSPFICLGTSDGNKKADVSPRGDNPGFVKVLSDKLIFIPERPGNKRIDSLSNIINNPEVGILFLIPGFDDCLRLNGNAKITQDNALLEASSVNGKTPKLGITVTVEEAFLHCAKAIKRSKLWDESSKQDRSELPTIGKMVIEQTVAESLVTSDFITEVDTLIEEDYKNELY